MSDGYCTYATFAVLTGVSEYNNLTTMVPERVKYSAEPSLTGVITCMTGREVTVTSPVKVLRPVIFIPTLIGPVLDIFIKTLEMGLTSE
jgi:hypothetical protein